MQWRGEPVRTTVEERQARRPTLYVRVDLEGLRRALTREDQRDWSLGDVRKWLIDARFRATAAGWWQVEEKDLGQLQPAEVMAVMDAADA